jgi:predicted acylesterase/phospholipase RssA
MGPWAVCQQGEEPFLLNYLSAPHCLVWSAIAASCAFPGMFPPQPLLCKARDGSIQIWRPVGDRSAWDRVGGSGSSEDTYSWHDGLVQEQAGMDSLRSLFNCNYFVVSQSNVYITMLLTLKHRIASLGPLYLKLADAWELEFKHRLRQLVEVAPWLDFLGAFRTLVQQWEGDLTVLHRGATLFGENSSPQVRVGFSPAVEGRPHGAASWRHALRRELLPAGKSRFLSSSGRATSRCCIVAPRSSERTPPRR